MSVLVMVFILMITGCGSSDNAEEPVGADDQMTENTGQAETEEKTIKGSIADEVGTISDVAEENTIAFTGTIIDHVLETLVPVVCVKTLEKDVIPYDAVFFELPADEADWGLRIGAVVTITCADTFTEQQIEEAKGIAFDYFTDVNIEYLEEKHYVNGIDCCNFIFRFNRKGDAEPVRIISLQLDSGVWEIINTFRGSEIK